MYSRKLLLSTKPLRLKASQIWIGEELTPWIRRMNLILRRSVLVIFQTSLQPGSEPGSVRVPLGRVYPVLM
ncbi:hypothetical protein [Green Sichuan pepper nepovirus satellite]|uniref:Uncharacterized protein n=1 Tax=Green Sichuan pepper nepovirus satellite TaxID=2851655 RepID=A0A8F3IXV4_9VIRU|nr:hypothetical protein [Green Sichuan pepper nepovirus satellite]QWY93768.1 hypothetical protein [Green Sichuan pepper nepovirus satellite]